jgi:hypothetical protein
MEDLKGPVVRCQMPDGRGPIRRQTYDLGHLASGIWHPASGIQTLRCLTALLAALILAGCAEELGPERFPTTSVSGRLTIRGQPVGGRWLEFLPGEGTLGNLRSAPLRPDGTFRVDRLPVGKLAIRLAGPPLPPTGNRDLDAFLARVGGAHWIVRDTGKSPRAMTIDLAEERLRLLRRFPPG